MINESVLAATLSTHGYVYGTKLTDIIRHYGSLMHLYGLWQENSHTVVPSELAKKLHDSWQANQLTQMQQLFEKYKIRACLIIDSDYPELLRQIPDAPYIFYFQGDLSIVSDLVCISCVGTRKMSTYGKRVINAIINPLIRYPLCFVSGLALGVDGEVHRQALNANVKTVAVLAGGLDVYEPSSHVALGLAVKEHGCLISEYPPGVRPQKHHFLDRNRIIAGLSTATVVIEGQHKSGSLVTARCALNYGREVGAVPGDIFLQSSEGTLQLIREGAWPISCSDDILAMVGIEQAEVIQPKDHGPLHAVLRKGPQTVDTLVQVLQLAPSQVSTQLTMLELDGLIECTTTGEYYIKA